MRVSAVALGETAGLGEVPPGMMQSRGEVGEDRRGVGADGTREAVVPRPRSPC